MIDYISDTYFADLYDNDGYAGYSVPNNDGGFDAYTKHHRFYGQPDAVGGYSLNGDIYGYTMPNAFGGQDIYTENGYEGTAMPLPF